MDLKDSFWAGSLIGSRVLSAMQVEQSDVTYLEGIEPKYGEFEASVSGIKEFWSRLVSDSELRESETYPNSRCGVFWSLFTGAYRKRNPLVWAWDGADLIPLSGRTPESAFLSFKLLLILFSLFNVSRTALRMLLNGISDSSA